MFVAKDQRPPPYGFPLFSGLLLKTLRCISEYNSIVIPRMYKPAPAARVGEDDTTFTMEAVGDVSVGPTELTTQRESSVFVELRTVLIRDMAVAAPGSISCSEIRRRFMSCLTVLPRAIAETTVAYGVRPRMPLPAIVEDCRARPPSDSIRLAPHPRWSILYCKATSAERKPTKIEVPMGEAIGNFSVSIALLGHRIELRDASR